MDHDGPPTKRLDRQGLGDRALDLGSNLPRDPDPVTEHYAKDIDRTLIRENLRKSIEQRLLDLEALQELANELGRAGSSRRLKRESDHGPAHG